MRLSKKYKIILENSKTTAPRLSTNLKYHLKNNLSLENSELRMGGKSWASLVNEVRGLNSKGILEGFSSDSLHILESDAGRFANFLGEKVPLDIPFHRFTTKEGVEIYGVFCENDDKSIIRTYFTNEEKMPQMKQYLVEMVESENGETENYMLLQNLKRIIQQSQEILDLPVDELDERMLGHQWAVDHISTAADDVDEVNTFLMHRDEMISIAENQSHEISESLKRWFKEKWVDISRKVKGKHPPCGRKKASKGGYPKCRPKVKVNSKTPKTAKSMSKKDKKNATARKRKAERKVKNKSKGRKPKVVK